MATAGQVDGDAGHQRAGGQEVRRPILPEGAFVRSARLDANGLSASTSPGSVTLAGVVRSWAEHDEAISAAWAAPGVTEVHDHIKVEHCK
jgi:BON domain